MAGKKDLTKPDISRLIEFHRLLNSFSEIERVIHLKRRDKIELESDSEHSYNLAMMAWFVADFFPELDRNKVIQLALVHDLVEVHAGDTFTYGEQAHLDSKADRERAAQYKLREDWPDFIALHSSISEYEVLETREACFTYALDKLMPMITIYLNDGITWKEKKLPLERLVKDKRQRITASPIVLKYWDEMHKILKQSPELFPR